MAEQGSCEIISKLPIYLTPEVISPVMSVSTPTDEGETTCTLSSRIQDPGSV
jgi:hypothetical protein